jgi:hypothetical protein
MTHREANMRSSLDALIAMRKTCEEYIASETDILEIAEWCLQWAEVQDEIVSLLKEFHDH